MESIHHLCNMYNKNDQKGRISLFMHFVLPIEQVLQPLVSGIL